VNGVGRMLGGWIREQDQRPRSMRRAEGLFEHIVAFGNLLAAERRAARGKRDREAVARFEFHLERELIEGCYRPGAFYPFAVRDPKPRAICAAPFRDLLEPVFERSAIFDSYACRVGKGTHAAIARRSTSPGVIPSSSNATCGASSPASIMASWPPSWRVGSARRLSSNCSVGSSRTGHRARRQARGCQSTI
jgi:hypothetical protein